MEDGILWYRAMILMIYTMIYWYVNATDSMVYISGAFTVCHGGRMPLGQPLGAGLVN
jgi:hypothetical protein